MKNIIPEEIHDWLNKRGISDAVLEQYEISFSNNKIVIPVHDRFGNFLFNKYRRNPFTEEGPKYQYQKGATSVLYGMNHYAEPSCLYIVEGEMDVLCASSRGLSAVSSTGGAGTFDESWAKFFEGIDTYICYDFDEAGIKGAFHVQSIIPWAKIIWLPKQVGEHGDLTDYFVKLGKSTQNFLSLKAEAKTYELPEDWKSSKNKTKTAYNNFAKDYAKKADELKLEARALREKNLSDRHISSLIEIYLNKLVEIKRAIKYFNSSRGMSGNKIAKAKTTPIPQFINFNNAGFAKCIWHNDSKPSMYWYEKQNRVKCFSCGKLGDVIDVVMKMQNKTLPEALKIILNE